MLIEHPKNVIIYLTSDVKKHSRRTVHEDSERNKFGIYYNNPYFCREFTELNSCFYRKIRNVIPNINK